MRRNDHNQYTALMYEMIRRLEARGDTYQEIAAQVRRHFRLTRFTRSNVAGVIHRLRRRGELPQSKRVGGNRSKGMTNDFDRIPQPPVSLAKV